MIKEKCPVDLESKLMLDIKPFQSWLWSKIDRYGSKTAAAEILGLSYKKMEEYLTGRRLDNRIKDPSIRAIPLDEVDRLYCREGDHIMEDYPSIYAF
jgi:molybdenum-dependent DNA-binding transcriptional regulator ModE